MQQGDGCAQGGAAPDVEGVVTGRRSVRASVERELKEELPARLAKSAIAATALAMAREIDAPANSATSKSLCAARLVEAMDRLHALAAEERQAGSRLDEIAKRREERLGRAAS